ncbi:hypothetical protein ACFL24_01430 [Patescibacteria group bacterium]
MNIEGIKDKFQLAKGRPSLVVINGEKDKQILPRYYLVITPKGVTITPKKVTTLSKEVSMFPEDTPSKNPPGVHLLLYIPCSEYVEWIGIPTQYRGAEHRENSLSITFFLGADGKLYSLIDRNKVAEVNIFTNSEEYRTAIREGAIYWKIYRALAEKLNLPEEIWINPLGEIGSDIKLAIEYESEIPFYEDKYDEATRVLEGAESLDCFNQEEKERLEDNQALYAKLVRAAKKPIGRLEGYWKK